METLKVDLGKLWPSCHSRPFNAYTVKNLRDSERHPDRCLMWRAARIERREPKVIIGTAGRLGSGWTALPRCSIALSLLCYLAPAFFLLYTPRIFRNPHCTNLRHSPSSHRAFQRAFNTQCLLTAWINPMMPDYHAEIVCGYRTQWAKK